MMVDIYKNKALLKSTGAVPVAVSLAFYNNLKMLELSLAALSRQAWKDFEIIICDDGSKPEIVEAVHKLIDQLDIPIKHLWHPDLGFRKNRILNWGLLHSDADYMIFIDQDCLAHPQFVREHFENRQEKACLSGRRMDLTPWVSSLLTPERVRRGFIESNLWWILPTGLYMKDNNGGKGVYLRNETLRHWANIKYRGLVGCNFSIHRQDMLAINGFDWRYEGPGTGEDSDVEYRLRLQGIKVLPFVNTAIQYHVYHRLLSRVNKNEEIFAQVQNEEQSITPYGLQQQIDAVKDL
ncbi:MAG: Chondroitin polymerase [Bdellovibrio sp. CG10_big_fil_rev_8_21_14_0_10_47_8]|nr:MAG: Chondroitin polymerase [Bdellovibrio sp. CG10_big_fil_rev_8_21_14_0_10_47_8]